MTHPTVHSRRVSTVCPVPSSILLSTDLSPRCDRALDRALLLARSWQAKLVALTVLEPGAGARSHPLLTRASAHVADASTRQQAERRLRADLDLPDLPDLPLAARVEQGAVAPTALEVAQAEASGLIVTGVARHEALSRIVLGSSVDALARSTPVPLLVVRERARANYRRVVVATDFDEASRRALETAALWFPQAQFTLFHAFGNAYPTLAGMDLARSRQAGYEAAERAAQAFLQETSLPEGLRRGLSLSLEYGDAGLLLLERSARHPADLVVLGTRRRGAVLGLLIGSVAQRILELAGNDVLLVPTP